MPALVYKPDTANERTFALKLGLNGVGRNPDNQICLNRADVSRYHAEIAVTPERVILKDLGSSNSSFVNGRKIRVTELADGDEVRFSSIRLCYRAALEVGSSTVDDTAAGADDALAARVAEQGQVADGVTPQRRAELEQMMADTPRRASTAGGGASLLRIPDGWSPDPRMVRLQVLLDLANRLSAPTRVAERMGQALELALGYLAVDGAAVFEQPNERSEGSGAAPKAGAPAAAPRSADDAAPAPAAGPQALAVRERDRGDSDADADFLDRDLVVSALAKGGPELSVDDAVDGRGVRVALAMPLGPSAPDAALYLASRCAAGPYDATELEFIAKVAEQLGIALANARALDALRADDGATEDSDVLSYGDALSWAASGQNLDSAADA